ncbi:MAG: beta-propeller fold lactonase family protein [Acidimicrobiales bacterium]
MQVGIGPVGIVVDQATDTVYVANDGANTVSVINGSTCNATNTSGCSRAPATVTVGLGPIALDVNEKTDTVYVSNFGVYPGAGFGLGTTVSVIDGATCNGQVTSGCGQTPPTVTVGAGSEGVVVDEPTDTVYAGSVAPSGAETVSVIDGASCNATIASDCSQTPPTVPVGTGNYTDVVAFAIDAATNTLYVANSSDNTVSMINEGTCNAMVTSGCGQTPKLVHVGAGPIGISLISATHTIYVVNSWDDTISVLDATTCNDMVTWSCGTQPRLLRTGGIPSWLTTDQATDTLYTPNATDNDVSVLNGATCNAMVTSGCAHFFLPAVDVGSGPQGAIVDEATDTVYVPNGNDDTVSVVDGATCNAIVTSGCDQSAPTVAVGSYPVWAALDGKNHTLYVANAGDNTMSVVNTATCNSVVTSGCGQSPPAVVVGSGPDGVAVDQQTDTIYVANSGDNTVSVIDGASCNATDTSDCTPTAPVTVGDGPAILAVDQATDTVYVPNLYDNTVSVIDGAKCNATVTSSCGATPPTVTVGNSPYDVAVDQATHTVYVANSNYSSYEWGSVSVINGATCNGQVSSGCGQIPPAVPVENDPFYLAIDEASNHIFVSNLGDDAVSVIDGATCNATITAGCAGTLATIPVGGGPGGAGVNEATGTVYIVNSRDNSMSVFGFG